MTAEQDEAATLADLAHNEAAADRREAARQEQAERRREDGPQLRLWEDR